VTTTTHKGIIGNATASAPNGSLFYLPVMNVFALSRRWFDFCFKNPDKVRPSHTAIYFFAIEHCNRMGWKRKYGFPTTMVMEAVGIKSYTTYKQTLDELVDWGFIEMVERTKNQYSSNIIALSFFDEAYVKAPDEALDKAMLKHASKQHQSTGESTVSIDIHNNQVTSNQVTRVPAPDFPSIEQCKSTAQMDGFTADQGEAYYHMRNANGWCVPRGKDGNLYPIINWRSDMATAIRKGYVDREAKSAKPLFDPLPDDFTF
jgi:hypothetical protein